MTYNFDPDKWYEDELFILQSKLKSMKITKSEYDIAVDALGERLEEMWDRLDGTYQVKPDHYN